MNEKEISPVEVHHLENTESRDVEHADEKGATIGVADSDARDYLDPTVVITEEESQQLKRKIHRKVLPLMCLAYLTQALDKGTLGPASIMGWQADVGAKGQDYALTSTLLWAGIICGEPIANQLVRRLPVAKLLGSAMLIWTALLLGLTFAHTIAPVFAIRFLLGFFESLFGPVLLSITVQWYLRQEQAFVSALWQSMLGVNSGISALFGYGFYHIPRGKGGAGPYDGRKLQGWQWMTLTVALISFCSALITLRFLPDSPTRARWATEKEKTLFVERVRSNNQGIKNTKFKREQLVEALKDQFTYLLFALAFFQTLVVGGINTFNSLLINKAFGFSVLDSQLLSIPLGVMAILTYLLMAWLVTKTRQALLCMVAFCIPNIAGTITLLIVAPTPSTRGGLIVAFYAMQFFQACNPSIFLMLARNSAGQTKKSITYAVTYIGWAGGNAIAPQIFQAVWAPRYLHSLEIHLALYGVFILTCLYTRWMLIRRNKQKEAAQALEGTGTNALAFEDLTDRQNPDFRYSL
ncbi:major facilitator superfamily domain-containing protein [Papiliotrema laurentii]|uniref:Major facilitator superfamily domain-containing protein n=1 Tax=Papiliotrema laurentii TaxID=5418 RepID=A0AAD9L882_PAPLA|nr:major facilitator superfamily domain-containing protein [Papiliotrema laurentii]